MALPNCVADVLDPILKQEAEETSADASRKRSNDIEALKADKRWAFTTEERL
ncbi:unnamed protein product [Dovyalis caffra]|uniref:Uncharacterized protein n=1 Tax=Dovyalis caffra TaxID=77055 RepID=A0AAV1QUD3_9ROSI|nr:unnamed protein product [Dovyalis caffra]